MQYRPLCHRQPVDCSTFHTSEKDVHDPFSLWGSSSLRDDFFDGGGPTTTPALKRFGSAVSLRLRLRGTPDGILGTLKPSLGPLESSWTSSSCSTSGNSPLASK